MYDAESIAIRTSYDVNSSSEIVIDNNWKGAVWLRKARCDSIVHRERILNARVSLLS
jgi:hypothetical protein